jgi:hypothetical protein
MVRKNLQKPHESRQDYQTPPELINAVEARFGELTWDLAASPNNAQVRAPYYFTDAPGGQSALDADWSLFGRDDLLWLNPPFGSIQHVWAPLVARWSKRLPWLHIVMLTPAAIGSEWFREHVHGKATVLALNPRLTFVGETMTYPKDCMLSCFGYGVAGFDVWRWQPTRAEKSVYRKAAKAARALAAA